MGVACGPREVDPKVHSSEEWCAWARGPNKERLESRGSAGQEMRSWHSPSNLRSFEPRVIYQRAGGSTTFPP